MIPTHDDTRVIGPLVLIAVALLLAAAGPRVTVALRGRGLLPSRLGAVAKVGALSAEKGEGGSAQRQGAPRGLGAPDRLAGRVRLIIVAVTVAVVAVIALVGFNPTSGRSPGRRPPPSAMGEGRSRPPPVLLRRLERRAQRLARPLGLSPVQTPRVGPCLEAVSSRGVGRKPVPSEREGHGEGVVVSRGTFPGPSPAGLAPCLLFQDPPRYRSLKSLAEALLSSRVGYEERPLLSLRWRRAGPTGMS